MEPKILVTGATGTVGTEVVRQLAESGVAVRAAVRSIEKAEKKFKHPNVESVEIDFNDPESLDVAFKGIEKLFLLTPLTDDQVDFGRMLVEAAKKHGVRHIVKLSVAGAEREPGFYLGRWHRETERYIESSGIPYTFLRPGSFMQNFINYFPPEGGKIQLPLGQGKGSYIDVRDIATVAAKALTEKGHEGKAYTLTGPESLSVAEVAEILSKVMDKHIEYVDVLEESERHSMIEMGMPEWMADAMMELHRITKSGNAAAVTDTFERVTGKKPRTFMEFAKDHESTFKQLEKAVHEGF
jgi:uncharacterized protein YbjT (DUF2867 family)